MKKLLILLSLIACVASSQARNWKTEKGYRGNVETGMVIGAGDWGKTQWILQTTHGYQVLPNYLFLGAGAGGGVFIGDEHGLRYSGQIFGDIRSHLPLDSKFSPFVDVKLGYEWNRNDDGEAHRIDIQDGFYLSPSVGVNYALNEKFGLELSLGYTYNQTPVTFRVLHIPVERVRHNIGGFTFRLGFNF
ncbi:MAG: hypothetical protein K2N03_05600 [Muribaculaceae bacterium]|nr:hypothetical protein [Muribaculaceae bacterium]